MKRKCNRGEEKRENLIGEKSIYQFHCNEFR